eukprot:jgi/Botrbrau1/12378/Bobra.0084s0003.2
MGVKDLWQLLEPVGRRINIEALTNKQLAVDASIWLHQFIKAMRNEKGEVLQNAHLLGFFRRICRLLFHKIRPVFVFDGATPVLKRRTAIARRRRREQQTAQLRKTAEKLLMNQLKKHALRTQRAAQEATANQVPEKGANSTANVGPSEAAAPSVLDKTVPVSSAAAQDDGDYEPEDFEDAEEEEEDEEDGDEQEELLLPEETEGLDPAVLSSLPQSMQLEALQRLRERMTLLNREKFQQQAVNPAGFSILQMQEYLRASRFRRQIDNLKDEMNAAAMASNGGVAAKKIASEVDRQYILADEGDTSLPPPPISTDEQGDGEKVEVELPAGVSLEELLQKSTSDRSMESSESEEWQDVGPPLHLPSTAGTREDAGQGSAGNNNKVGWKERMKQRQKYWSLSHGFKFGRKLADWSKSDDQEEMRVVREAAGLEEEEADLQEAIRRSLHDRAIGQAVESSSDSESWLQWEAAPPPRNNDEAGPSCSAQSQEAGPSHQEAGPSHQETGPSHQEAGPSRQEAGSSHQEAGPSRQEAGPLPQSSSLLPAQEVQRTPYSPRPGWEGDSSIYASKAFSKLAEETRSVLFTAAKGIGKSVLSAGITMARSGPSPSPIYSTVDNDQELGKKSLLPQPDHANDVQDGSTPPSTVAAETHVGLPAGMLQAGRTEDPKLVDGPPHGTTSPTRNKTSNRLVLHIPAPEGKEGNPGTPVGLVMQHLAAGTASGDPQGAGAAEEGSVKGLDRLELGTSKDASRDTDAIPVDAREPPQVLGLEGDASKGMPKGAMQEEEEEEQEQAVDTVSNLQQEVLKEVMEAAIAGGISEEDLVAALHQEDDWDFLDREPAPASQSLPSHADLAQSVDDGGDAAGPNLERLPPQSQPSATFDFDAELEMLEVEQQALEAEARRQQVAGESPTNEMYGECQELLQMFGIPYIIAPMEAEAQCAWLDAQGLVHGVVTDDNDVFLFGAKHVYRNIFSDRKYVEEYRFSDMETELGLDQVGLIQLALLLGSDYTEGIHGIGIVNAVEVVHAFPGEKGLEAFRDWVVSPDQQLLALARGQATAEVEDETAALKEFKRKHAGVRKNWDVPEGFPQAAIMRAYLDPRVDDNKQSFTYGRPDIELLRTFCWEKFGWPRDKSEQLLLPVLKAYDDRHTQTTMTQFLSFSQRFAKFKSARLQKAVKGVSGRANEDLHYMDLSSPDKPAREQGSQRGEEKKKSAADASDEDVLPSNKRKRKAVSRGGQAGKKTNRRKGLKDLRSTSAEKDAESEPALVLMETYKSPALEATEQRVRTKRTVRKRRKVVSYEEPSSHSGEDPDF